MKFVLPQSEIEQLVGSLDERQVRLLTEYGRRVVEAPRRLGLVSRNALTKLGEHFVDSAAVLGVVEAGVVTVADLGSGGGFPGVVMAILRPSLEVTLVDSRHGKVAFLKSVARHLELENVGVDHSRIEDIGSARFDLVVCRAVGPLRKTLRPSLRLMAERGLLVLFKGRAWSGERGAAEELAGRDGFEIAWEKEIELPGLDRATRFVGFRRRGAQR